MMNLNDLGLEFKLSEPKTFTCGDETIGVVQYLPIDEKANLIKYVIDWSLDDNTGCFSPIRVEVFFSIALCKWYASMEFEPTAEMPFSKIYDILETNHIIETVMDNIPEDELNFLQDLVNDTIKDVARYNNSAAGIIQAMNANAEGLNGQISSILEKIKNSEGLEQLSAIKDVVGNN